jgi:hypothetical protein
MCYYQHIRFLTELGFNGVLMCLPHDAQGLVDIAF